MMGGMGGGIVWMVFLYSLLFLALVLNLAYIVWTIALKESGYVKTTGLAFACGMTVLAIIIFFYGLVYGGGMRENRSMMGGGMGRGNMMMEGKGGKMLMKKMMKDPEMMKMMKEMMGKEMMTK
ncbi:MAG: hypothetical protein ABIH50_01915 [bacterium]